MEYLIDSSAWIEYLEGSEKGERVARVLKKEKVYSLNLIVSEVISKIKRVNKNFDLAYRIILSNSRIFEITPEIAKEIGLFHAEMKKRKRNFGLIDACILICARKLKSKILTQDDYFKEFKEAILL